MGLGLNLGQVNQILSPESESQLYMVNRAIQEFNERSLGVMSLPQLVFLALKVLFVAEKHAGYE